MIGPCTSKWVRWCLPMVSSTSFIVKGDAETARDPCDVRLRLFHSDLVQQGQNFLFDAV